MDSFVLIRVLSIITALIVLILSYTVLTLQKPKKVGLVDRLPNTKDLEMDDIINDTRYSDTRYGRFYKACIKPQFDRNPNILQQLSRSMNINMEKLDAKIKEARLEKTFTVEEILSMKLLGYIGMFVCIGSSLMLNFNTMLIIMGVAAYYAGSILPQRIIETKLKQRREEIENSLPNFLDLLKSVTESGLVIQEALNKVTARTKGALSEEFKAVMVETKSNGGNWRLAMENMALRNDIDALSDVISDILITYEKGTSITETLAKESKQMRLLRNSHLQEKAKSLSIKLLIPMAFFCFVPMFVLMLAPMLMKFTTQMG